MTVKNAVRHLPGLLSFKSREGNFPLLWKAIYSFSFSLVVYGIIFTALSEGNQYEEGLF